MNRTKNIVALAITLMSSAAISTPAFAGDNKVYSGSACMPASYSVLAGISLGNQFNNFTGQSINVRCPIVRDETGGAEGGGPDTFIDVSSPTVKCSLNTTRLEGGTFASRTATPFQVSPGVFRYDIRDVPQVSQGAYNISCNLPNGTSILRYSLGE